MRRILGGILASSFKRTGWRAQLSLRATRRFCRAHRANDARRAARGATISAAKSRVPRIAGILFSRPEVWKTIFRKMVLRWFRRTRRVDGDMASIGPGFPWNTIWRKIQTGENARSKLPSPDSEDVFAFTLLLQAPDRRPSRRNWFAGFS